MEDEDINAIVSKRFLDNKFIVDIAHTPTKALEMCKLKKYRIILININLKSTIDGIELKELITKEYK